MAKCERDVEKEQYWRLVLEEFGASGQSVRDSCRSEETVVLRLAKGDSHA